MAILCSMLFAFFSLASAMPLANNDPTNGVSKLATFDDIKTVPETPQLTPVGKYMGLDFRSFNAASLGVAGTKVIGLIPASGKQVATNGIITNTETGSPALIPASPYKTIDLKSLYFACVLNTVTSAAIPPEQCTVAFTAYLPGSKVAYQTINQQFNPTNPTLSKMQRATFPSTWQKMGKIEIAIVQSTATPTLTGLAIDSVAYTLYQT